VNEGTRREGGVRVVQGAHPSKSKGGLVNRAQSQVRGHLSRTVMATKRGGKSKTWGRNGNHLMEVASKFFDGGRGKQNLSFPECPIEWRGRGTGGKCLSEKVEEYGLDGSHINAGSFKLNLSEILVECQEKDLEIVVTVFARKGTKKNFGRMSWEDENVPGAGVVFVVFVCMRT